MEVEWSNINSEASGFIMAQISDNQYKISTSVETRFSFSSNYKFEFIGVFCLLKSAEFVGDDDSASRNKIIEKLTGCLVVSPYNALN